MPNLLITDYCNRSCPYCFAKEKVVYKSKKDKINRFISMDNLEKVIQYLKNSGMNLFSVLGGEPTLHPNFIEVFNRILKEDFKIRIFSNGLIPENNLNYLALKVLGKKKNIEIILNINHPQMTSHNEWQSIENTLKKLKKSVTLSFNIFDINIDFDFLIDVINKYQLNKNIRLGIAQPIVGIKNKFLNIENYPEIGQKIVKYSERCDKFNIKIGLDCGFILCMFNETQIGKLIYNNVNFSILCGSIIDIGPDLTVWRCFPLSKIHNVKLTEFENEQQLKNYYDNIYKPYRRFGIMDKCFKCKYLLRGQCTGGCIAHKVKMFKGEKCYGI